jgi:phospholipase C
VVPAEHLLPFHLDTANSGIGECTHDLNHTWPAEHQSRGQGDNADFVRRVHTRPTIEGPEHGVLTMGYYDRADLPFYYALADAFTICDNYHCSVMGPTHPNRLMALSGTIDPAGKAGGPGDHHQRKPRRHLERDWDTMPEVLEDAGVSWKVYNPAGALYAPTFFEQNGLQIGDAILPYFSQYKNPASALYQKAFLPQYPNDFVTDVVRAPCRRSAGSSRRSATTSTRRASGRWASGSPARCSDTWSPIPRCGPRRCSSTCTTRTTASSTTCPRRSAQAGTPGEFLTSQPLPRRRRDLAGPIGMGFRVPMLVVSPFSRGGHVARTSSTTPRSCASSKSASASGLPTSRPGAAAPRAT